MARGEKFCKKCNARNGPRAWSCVSCGAGFLVKGTQHPDITPGQRDDEAKDARQGLDRIERRKLMALIEVCKEHQETATRRKFYGPKSRTFQSVCGKYRIRYCPEFMGVPIALDDNRPYRLLVLTKHGWEIPRHKSRFKKLWGAIKFISKVQNEPAETKEGRGRPSVRVSRVRGRKLVNA